MSDAGHDGGKTVLQIDRSDVVATPFPHVAKMDFLPPDLFARLSADFPTSASFEDQFSQTGATGSRVGAGTGFDIYRGDLAYDRLVAGSAAWAELDAYINSAAFVTTFLDVFGEDLAGLGCSITVDPAAYRRDMVESRSTLTARQTIGERLGRIVDGLGRNRNRIPTLFTRLDVEKSFAGYAKPPHCDRSNRLCSLILYFSDLEAEGIEGGELNIYAHKSDKSPAEHERHPKPALVDVVATLKPKPNLGVFFPCSNNSYHGVNAVETAGKARNFLYINISTDGRTCW